MRNLLRIIINNQFLLLFLIFEIISISFVVHNNNYHQGRYFSASQNIHGYFSRKKEKMLQYLSLREINLQLADENARLKNELEQLRQTPPTKISIVKDTAHKQMYSYITARVVNNSVNKQYNYLMVDKGSLDSIKPEMAVISPNGVVGIVESVTDRYALIISLLNRNLKVSAKIKKNNYFGAFEWSGTSYKRGLLTDIPLHVQLAKGDTIITSGFSSTFPEGIMLGYISDFSNPGGNFYDIDLDISNDFKNLSYVYIVTSFRKEEQKQLELKAKQ
jgi:rod shape-determining protein MreC